MKNKKMDQEYSFALRPASIEEVGLFYSNDEQDEALGTVGHLRLDFGHGFLPLRSTCYPHNDDQFNTLEFKMLLREFLEAMQDNGPLASLSSMEAYCQKHGGAITEDGQTYGYVWETEQYRFCLRCTPSPFECQGYLYCYDLWQQQIQKNCPVGQVTYASGEQQMFTVVQHYLQTIREELPYDNDKTTILNLPASDADIWRAVGEVDAASLDECAFRCIDCEIPSLRDAVDDAIEQEGGIGMASEFAANLAQKKQSWHEADWVKYKALLSVAGCPSLQDAIQLMHGLDDYDLRPDVAATWDYAEVVLREKYPDLPEELFQTPQAAMVGRQMLEENHAAITDYGLFRRKDNGQLPVFQREPQAMDSPQMGGM